jgi:hypothetical protein
VSPADDGGGAGHEGLVDLVADCPADAQAAEPVQQAIAGSAIYRCCPPLVAGGGPRGGPRRPTGLSWVFFILAGIAAATAVQQLYQRVFGQDSRGLPDRLRAVIWLALAFGWIALGTAVAPGFRASAPVLRWIVNIPAFIGFWWFTMWFLLGGRVSWRRLYPVRRGHRRVLAGHAGGLLGHLFRHGHQL